MASGDAWRSLPERVVTVADLLKRNTQVTAKSPTGDGTPSVLSVNNLLRREGHGPSDGAAEGGERSLSGRVVRRSAVAAGTLLAAGGVFGIAAVTDTAHTGSNPFQDGAYPGQGRLDAAAPQNPLTAGIDQGGNGNALDPGVGAPNSWVAVAFPTNLASAAQEGATTGATPAVHAPAADAGAGNTPVADNGGGGGNHGGGNNGGGGSTPVIPVPDHNDGTARNQGPVGGLVDKTGNGLGNGLQGATNNTPLAPVGNALGKTVDQASSGLGDTLGGVTGLLGLNGNGGSDAKHAAPTPQQEAQRQAKQGPVGGLVDQAGSGLGNGVKELGGNTPLAPVTGKLGDAVNQTTKGLGDTLGSVTGLLGLNGTSAHTTAPSTHQDVQRHAKQGPVGGLVNDAASGIGSGVKELGGNTPLAPVTNTLGDVVNSTSKGLGDTLGAVTSPLTSLLSGGSSSGGAHHASAPRTSSATHSDDSKSTEKPAQSSSTPRHQAADKPSSGGGLVGGLTKTVGGLLGG